MFCLIALCMLASETFGMDIKKAEVSFRSIYPQVQYRHFGQSEIDGLYEVLAGDNLIYFHPKTGNLIFGEIWSKKGFSVTQNKREELLKPVKNDSEYSEAVRIGNGSKVVVEISDPDCPYCRTASGWLDKRTDITRYVYFIPLDDHMDAEWKAKYILCSKNRLKAYREVYSGKFDQELPPVLDECHADGLIQKHIDFAVKAGVYETPVFFIDRQRVDGADMERIETLLGK